MSNKVKIIIASVLFAVIVGLSVVFALNFDTVKDTVSANSFVYTYADIERSRQEGYLDGIGRKEYYESTISELNRIIIENKQTAQAVYDAMVEMYETEITRLTLEISRLDGYSRALEGYIIDLNIDFDGSINSLAALELQLSAYRTIKSNLLSDIAYYTSVLDNALDLTSAYSNLNEAVYRIENASLALASPCSFAPFTLLDTLVSSGVLGSTQGYTYGSYHFGNVLTQDEYEFAVVELNRFYSDGYMYLPGNRSSVPIISPYFSSNGMNVYELGLATVYYPTYFSIYVDYYESAVKAYEEYLDVQVQRAVDLEYYISVYDYYDNYIDTVESSVIIANYVIGVCNSSLDKINENITRIELQINNK
jgi:hypothetical protein